MTPPIRLGLRETAGQFALLVLINGFVGAMVGLERAVLPLLGEREFGVASRTALLAFVGGFGLVKAHSNLFAGHFSERTGRRPLLIAGWLADRLGILWAVEAVAALTALSGLLVALRMPETMRRPA